MATFGSSQRGNSCPLVNTVHCGQRPQHLRIHREEIRALRPSQFIVAKDHNIWEFTGRQFVSFGHQCSLWPKITTFESSQRGYSCPSATTVHCGQKPQHLRVHSEAIYVIRPPHFIVAKNHNIWEFTEKQFMSFGHHCSLWPKIATFESSQRRNFWEFTERKFVLFGHHC